MSGVGQMLDLLHSSRPDDMKNDVMAIWGSSNGAMQGVGVKGMKKGRPLVRALVVGALVRA